MSAAPTAQLFNSLTANYHAHRPNYPGEILAALSDYAAPLPAGVMVDIGSGTGILLRQLCDTFGHERRFYGIEPGKGMLAAGRSATPMHLPVTFIEASAESVPLPASSAALITVAQTLHWLDRKRFYAEAARLLAKGGTFAVLYNQRDISDPLMEAYERFTNLHKPQGEGDAAEAADRGGLGIVLLRNGRFRSELTELIEFDEVAEIEHSWTKPMTPEEFVGMCLSTVQMQNVVRSLGESEALARLRKLISDRIGDQETLVVPYRTSLIAAKRR